MDQEIVRLELQKIMVELRRIRKETWGEYNQNIKGDLPIDKAIWQLESVISEIAYNEFWNGVHPVGQSG